MTYLDRKNSLRRPICELLRQFDLKILLRFPLFWRTRVLYFLLVLCSTMLIVGLYLYLLFSNMYIVASWGSSLSTFVDIWSALNWVGVSFIFLYTWFIFIALVPVGDIPPRWHFTTMYTTIIGAYICMIMSGILPYSIISAIKNINITDDKFSSDMQILSSYDRWRCVPETVAGNSDEFWRLQGVLASYGQTITFERSATRSEGTYCEKSEFPLTKADVVKSVYYGINLIQDSRKIDADAKSERNFNMFKGFGINIYQWPIILSVLFGLVVTAASYPWYVWRRTIWRR
jgi:hypothetical protein